MKKGKQIIRLLEAILANVARPGPLPGLSSEQREHIVGLAALAKKHEDRLAELDQRLTVVEGVVAGTRPMPKMCIHDVPLEGRCDKCTPPSSGPS